MNLEINDLVMFRYKGSNSIVLELIKEVNNYNGIKVCKTEPYSFREDNFKIVNEYYTHITNWLDINRNDIEVVGVWRFNNQTKNYEVLYYEQ